MINTLQRDDFLGLSPPQWWEWRHLPDAPHRSPIVDFAVLPIGGAAYSGEIVALAMAVEGVRQATATLNGTASVTPAGTALLTLDDNAVTT